MITDEMVEAAAEAIFETWREREGAEASWEAALKATEAPNEYPKLCRAVDLARAEAKAALTAAMAKMWRPIESAPKDGTRFWGKVDGDAIAMLWHPTFNAFVSSWRRMEMAAGYTVDGASFKDHSPTIQRPEAWMTFAPPETEVAK